MALPPTAKAFPQALGPADQLDFYPYVSQGAPGASPAPILLTGEGIASYTLALTSEAIAAGLEIMIGDYANQLVGNELALWLRVADDMQGSALFNGAGVTVGIEMAIVTTNVPPRRKTRTFLLRIANQ